MLGLDPCIFIHGNIESDYGKFTKGKKLERDHALFITLDNKLFNPIKSKILNSCSTTATDEEIARRDITLDIIEEFQASEVPFYSRLHIESRPGNYQKAPMKELCEVSMTVLKTLHEAYTKTTTDTGLQLEDSATQKVTNFYNSQIELRTKSVLRTLFVQGRGELRKINKAIFDMERIASEAPADVIKQIKLAGETVYTKFAETMAAMEKEKAPAPAGSIPNTATPSAPGAPTTPRS